MITRKLGRFVAASLLVGVVSTSIQADPVRVVSVSGNRTSRTPKEGSNVLRSAGSAKGKGITHFHFHPDPGWKEETAFTKRLVFPLPTPRGQVNFGHVSPPHDETHETGGEAQYLVSYWALLSEEDGLPIFYSSGRVEGTIDPGTAERKFVKITAEIADPFVFSDDDPDAFFTSNPGGVDLGFTLLADSTFPDVFAPDLDSFGALAEETSMEFRSRIAPGAVGDPDEFWADDLPGHIDLFRLVLRPDDHHNITADLTFGASTGDFTLDFRDRFGNAFDPTDALAVSAIEAFVASSFAGGTLNADLEDIFRVGFVPRAGLGAYTSGDRNQLVIGAVEVVPEPGSLALIGLGAPVVAAGRRLRSFLCRARRPMRDDPEGHPGPPRRVAGTTRCPGHGARG